MSGSNYTIDYKKAIQLGGVEQHIRVRGTRVENPVILFLHGGPGVCDRHWVLKYQSGLADVCTLVCWDQRGAGKSYNKEQAARKMSLETVASDACELIEYLSETFGQEKIIIVGHSWGSVLGVLVSQRIPQRIAAYVGMGQVVDFAENEDLAYQFVWEEATRRNDKKALRDLERIGKPERGNYGSLDNLIVQRNYMSKYGGGTYGKSESALSSLIFPLLQSPEYTLLDLYKYAKGSFYCLGEIWEEMVEVINFKESATELAVPVFLTEGRHDQNTPCSIAEAWFDTLEAPYKEWIWFEESAHSPIKEEPELWAKAIRERVLTVAAQNSALPGTNQ